MTWIRAPRVHAVLRDLATGTVPLDHGALDAIPPSRTVEYVRGLLVAHGALPDRDRHLATYETWLAAKLAKLTDDQERQILERFGRWHHARALRQHAATGPVPRGAFLRAKQSTTVTAGFLSWLTEHGTTLSGVTQADIDRWYAGGTTTRALIETFLYWAINQRLMPRVTVPRRSTAGKTALETSRESPRFDGSCSTTRSPRQCGSPPGSSWSSGNPSTRLPPCARTWSASPTTSSRYSSPASG
jgi:hypothetical protein